MSLPAYRKSIDNEETIPLYQPNTRNSFDEPAPTYPPALGQASGSTTTSGGRASVTFTFIPRYPIKGSAQDALGVCGSTKAETIAIVQRGFPILAEYPPERIEFFVPVSGRLGKVMDEAWERFEQEPPPTLWVIVADGPGDKDARDRYQAIQFVAIIVSIFIVCGMIVLIFWLCRGLRLSP